MGPSIRFANLPFFPPAHTMARRAPLSIKGPTDRLALGRGGCALGPMLGQEGRTERCIECRKDESAIPFLVRTPPQG